MRASLIVGLATGVFASSCSQPAPKTLAEALQRVDGRVSVEGGTVNVDTKLHQAARQQNYVVSTLEIMKQVSDALKVAPPASVAPLSVVAIRISGPAIDPLGREAVDPFFDLAFSAQDLRQARPENLSYGRMLDLAHTVRTRGGAGLGVLRAFCADKDMGAEGVTCGELLTTGRLP